MNDSISMVYNGCNNLRANFIVKYKLQLNALELNIKDV